MEEEVKKLDFGMMPKVEGMVTFADRIIMYDNLDRPMDEAMNDDVRRFISDLPKRVTFAIVILCVEGYVEINCNLRHMEARRGGLIVIVPGTIAESLYVDPSSHLIVLSVPDQEYAPSSSFENATYAQSNFTSPISTQLDESVLKSGIDIYSQLKNTIRTMGDKVTDDLVKAYILVMAGIAALSLQKWVVDHPSDKKKSREKVLDDFLYTLDKDHREHREVSYYAGKAGLSPKYFAKLIQEVSGKRPLEWIRDCVILDAKAMIKSREYSIGQICEILNFRPQSMFNRYFKDATGMAPLQYAKKG